MGVQYSISSIYNVTGKGYNSSAKTGSITQPTNGAGGKFTTHRLTNTAFISKWSYAEAEIGITPPSSPDIYKSITVKYRYIYDNDVNGSWQTPTVRFGHKDASGNKIYGTHSHGGGSELNQDTWSGWFTETLSPSLYDSQYRLLFHIQNNQDLSALKGVTVEIDSITINYTPHICNFSIETARTPATCVAEGSVTHKCSVTGCNKTQTTTLTIDPNNHTGSQQTLAAVAATCTTAGKTEGKKWSCCNAIITAQQTINATGHNNNTTIPAVSPTCTSTGFTEGKKCSVCGTVTVAQTSVAALGHLYASPKYSWASDGTSCSVTGTCSRSGCGSTKTINANISSLVTTQPSCLTDGVKTFTATFGETWATNQTKNITLSATGHSFGSITPAKQASCLSSGNSAYKKCSNCNLYFPSDASTNSTVGSSDTSQFLISQIDHSFTGEIKSDGNYKDATHSFKCVNGCNNYGNATKHTWDDGKITTQPSCESTGIKTYTCAIANCGGTYTEIVPANGHTWVSATCTTPKTCSVCGAKEGEALGHDYDIEVVDPTNSSLGYTIYTCKRDGCGYTCTDNFKCLITVNCDTTMGYVSGSGVYTTGTSVTITATANSGYKFVGWSDGVSSNTRTITADNSMTYTAIFVSDKLYFGTSKPKKIFVGEQEVKAIYIDTIKVYG